MAIFIADRVAGAGLFTKSWMTKSQNSRNRRGTNRLRFLMFQVNVATDEPDPTGDEEEKDPRFFLFGQREASSQPDHQLFKNQRALFHEEGVYSTGK